jgi:uncharacterized protein (DUF433 family)
VRNDDVMGGEPRIEGRRITAETVAEEYDLRTADVYRALTYYHEHPDEMEAVDHHRRQRERAALESGAKTMADLPDDDAR